MPNVQGIWRSLHLCQNECRCWVETHIPSDDDIDYHWSQRPEDVGRRKGEWEKWGSHTWEVFWGYGDTPQTAMADLETRKLKRDWVGINWVGESSSLSGTDAIAWSQLGKPQTDWGRSLSDEDQAELKRFYLRLAWILDDPRRTQSSFPDNAALARHFEEEDGGKFITPRERLSVPELVKRLATWPTIARQLDLAHLGEGFPLAGKQLEWKPSGGLRTEGGRRRKGRVTCYPLYILLSFRGPDPGVLRQPTGET